MSYTQVTRAYYEPLDPYYPDWKEAPFPGWGQRPEIAGPMFIATSGLGGLGATLQPNAIDLSDAAVMKELRSLIGLLAGKAEGYQVAFVEKPSWDNLALSLFSSAILNANAVLKRPDVSATTTLVQSAVVPYPSALGVLMLGQAIKGDPAELAKAFPRIGAWMKTCGYPVPVNCITLPPKFDATPGPGPGPVPSDQPPPTQAGAGAGTIALAGGAVLAGGFLVYKLFSGPKKRARA